MSSHIQAMQKIHKIRTTKIILILDKSIQITKKLEIFKQIDKMHTT